MEQWIVDPLISYASVGEEGDGMYLVTGRTEEALCVQPSGSFFPVRISNPIEQV